MSKPAIYVNIKAKLNSLDIIKLRKCFICKHYFNTDFNNLEIHISSCKFKATLRKFASLKPFKKNVLSDKYLDTIKIGEY